MSLENLLHPDQAAKLVAAVRLHVARSTPCSIWDVAGISAALRSTTGTPGSVIAAALLAAEDTTLRAPSAQAFANHWPMNARSEKPRPSNDIPCPEGHGFDLPCPVCASETRPAKPEELARLRESISTSTRQQAYELAERRRAKAAAEYQANVRRLQRERLARRRDGA